LSRKLPQVGLIAALALICRQMQNERDVAGQTKPLPCLGDGTEPFEVDAVEEWSSSRNG
jgi:hypothetical protein